MNTRTSIETIVRKGTFLYDGKIDAEQSNSGSTRLYFGSAVVPELNARTGQASYGFAFHAMLGFHRLYSRALLRSAVSRLAKLNKS